MAGVFHRWRYLEEFEDVQHPGELGRTVLGLPDKAIWQRLARTQSDLVKARTAAVERDRPVPAYRDLRIVGRSWGWLELQIYPPDGPELYDIVGVGVAAPGSRPTVEMAESHQAFRTLTVRAHWASTTAEHSRDPAHPCD